MDMKLNFVFLSTGYARDPSYDAMQSLPKVSDRGGRSCRDNPRCPDGNIAQIETGMDMDSG